MEFSSIQSRVGIHLLCMTCKELLRVPPLVPHGRPHSKRYVTEVLSRSEDDEPRQKCEMAPSLLSPVRKMERRGDWA